MFIKRSNLTVKEAKELEVASATSNESHFRSELVKENDEDYKIELLIRERYSLSQEIALLRKIHIGETTEEEFKAYSDYVKECIAKARTLEQ